MEKKPPAKLIFFIGNWNGNRTFQLIKNTNQLKITRMSSTRKINDPERKNLKMKSTAAVVFIGRYLLPTLANSTNLGALFLQIFLDFGAYRHSRCDFSANDGTKVRKPILVSSERVIYQVRVDLFLEVRRSDG